MSVDTKPSQLVTVKDAATRLACSEAAIRKWRFQGKLKPVKVGSLLRFRAEDIERIATKGL
jgi:excisionase family DNA binding protein